MLDGFGPDHQARLSRARVLLVGAGALGSASAPYLAGSGVGHIGIADFDTVDLSNLQRQPLFTEADLGKPKASTLAARLQALNSETRVDLHPTLVSARNCDAILATYDVVLEGSDNPSTKYLIADACVRLGKACIIGGVRQYEGQVTTYLPAQFALSSPSSSTPSPVKETKETAKALSDKTERASLSYRELFPEAAPQCGFTPCALGGVFGPLAGMVGSVMAAEAVKVITGIGEPLANRLLLIDARTMEFRVIRMG